MAIVNGLFITTKYLDIHSDENGHEILRQLKKIGYVSYISTADKRVNLSYKEVLCLHLFPVAKIESVFYHLLSSVRAVTRNNDTPNLKKRFGYKRQTWITNHILPKASGVNIPES